MNLDVINQTIWHQLQRNAQATTSTALSFGVDTAARPARHVGLTKLAVCDMSSWRMLIWPCLDYKFFHSLSITSNLWTHVWSIKYR